MLAAFKRVQYYEIKAYSGHFYTQKAGKRHFVALWQGDMFSKTISLGVCIFCTYQGFIQFALLKDVFYMASYY